jgi:Cell division protein
MATRKRKTSKGSGITLYGIVLGVLLGLAAAVAVALFVTKVPMPFTDKASQSQPNVLLPDVRDAPDPNLGLHGRSTPVPGTGVAPSPTLPAPGVPPTAQTPPATPPAQDNLGNLIARLESAPPPEPQVATPAQVAKPAPPQSPSRPPEATAKSGTYFLQAGAFRSTGDAEAMRARVIMLGLPAQVQTAEVNGATLHRVRVGPFKGLDEMNQARSRLGTDKIETSVVRQ